MKAHRKKRKVQSQPQQEKAGIFKGVAAAYLILILHAVFIALLGCLVLFFRGMVQYMLWIFIGGTALVSYSGYRVYRRMKQEQRNFSDLLRLPMLDGNSIEVSFLGGMASVRVESPGAKALPVSSISYDASDIPRQLEAPGRSRVGELTELANLFEKQLITLEEYETSKKQIIGGISFP
jgi:hypothetical protein